jgi:hypothetical protein
MAGGLLLAACSGSGSPVKSFVKGEELAAYDFTQPGTFEEGSYGDNDARLQIREGAYTINITKGDSQVWYGQWGDTYGDVVIDVDTRQVTESQNTSYGVMCRMRGAVGQVAAADSPLATIATDNSGDSLQPSLELTAEATADATAEATAKAEATGEATPEPTVKPEATGTASGGATNLNPNNGDGYLFLIEGSGRFAIMRAKGRSVTPLVNWTGSDKIKTGAAQNHIRAVCMGTYLAMYINGQFVGDATDDAYTRGQVGLAGAAASRLGLQISFDNLTISAAKPG